MTALAFNLSLPNKEPAAEETNQFSVKMAGQVRATQKRRKSRAQRLRSRRR